MKESGEVVEIVRFEALDAAHDEAAAGLLRTWWELGRDSEDGRVYPTWPAWETVRSARTTPGPERDLVHLVARVAGRPVGWGLAIAFTNDNTHVLCVDFGVLAAFRGQRVGSVLVEAVEAIGAEWGKTTYLAEVYRRPGEPTAREQLLLHHGYVLANLEEEKAVTVAEFRSRREHLEANVARRIGDYRVITYRDHCPDDYVESYVAMLSTFMGEIPLGDMDLHESVWSVDRLRATEARSAAISGEHRVRALALTAGGEVVGASDIRWDEHLPELAFVGMTQVLDGHRGHALGLALKLATHGELVDACPGLERIFTSNAHSNRHMNAVNEQLGYVVHEELLEMQKVL